MDTILWYSQAVVVNQQKFQYLQAVVMEQRNHIMFIGSYTEPVKLSNIWNGGCNETVKFVTIYRRFYWNSEVFNIYRRLHWTREIL